MMRILHLTLLRYLRVVMMTRSPSDTFYIMLSMMTVTTIYGAQDALMSDDVIATTFSTR